jgi:preprotein translocase subunit SecG
VHGEMMLRDWLDYAFICVVFICICLIAFIALSSNKMDDCTKRGGTVIDTAGGWVCAKIERI